MVDLVHAEGAEKGLLLAAISAVGGIHPEEAQEILEHLENSNDPEVEEAVLDATPMGGEWGEDGDDEPEDDEDDSDSPE